MIIISLKEYETLLHPQGFELKLCLLTTHGDINYIGLNGLEVYDFKGNDLIKSKLNVPIINAKPSSVKIFYFRFED